MLVWGGGATNFTHLLGEVVGRRARAANTRAPWHHDIQHCSSFAWTFVSLSLGVLQPHSAPHPAIKTVCFYCWRCSRDLVVSLRLRVYSSARHAVFLLLPLSAAVVRPRSEVSVCLTGRACQHRSMGVKTKKNWRLWPESVVEGKWVTITSLYLFTGCDYLHRKAFQFVSVVIVFVCKRKLQKGNSFLY